MSSRRAKKTLLFVSLVTFALLLIQGCDRQNPNFNFALDAATTRYKFGAFTYGGVWQGMQPVYDLEASIGKQLYLVNWFMNFDTAWDASLLTSASQNGRLPMISWQPTNKPLDNIIAGQYNTYIKSWAKGAKTFGKPLYIRLMPEMNGNWTTWNDNPTKYIQAWKRIVNTFRSEGASNVKWVWCVNRIDEPATAQNKMELYYPGSSYVDILAIDGFNFGTSRTNSAWRSFDDTFRSPYARVAKLGTQPIWFTETGSSELGGDKAAWVRSMFASTAFPRLELITWFNENKETDWRVNSSTASIEAFKSGLAPAPVLAAQ
jgi:hypothetical protein